jgi:hypothetical protein
MFRVMLPVLVTITVWLVLNRPTGWVLNARLSGEIVAVGVSVRPFPNKLTVCGLPVAVSIKVMEPVRLPAAVGLNSTFTVQVAEGRSVAHEVLVI